MHSKTDSVWYIHPHLTNSHNPPSPHILPHQMQHQTSLPQPPIQLPLRACHCHCPTPRSGISIHISPYTPHINCNIKCHCRIHRYNCHCVPATATAIACAHDLATTDATRGDFPRLDCAALIRGIAAGPRGTRLAPWLGSLGARQVC
jgi:hypothetical protein